MNDMPTMPVSGESDIAERFPTLITRLHKYGWTVTERGCWEWQGSRHPRDGYGQIAGTAETGPLKTHRVAYELAHGPIPEGFYVCHSCDNPPCMNPAHLFAGTARDNNHDRRRKGRTRSRHGVTHKDSKLNPAAVLAIRASTESHNELARRYGVSDTSIRKVRKGLTWKTL